MTSDILSHSEGELAAVRILPRRDPVTGCTICYLLPVGEEQVELYTATRQRVGRAAAADWPPDGQPAQPTVTTEPRS